MGLLKIQDGSLRVKVIRESFQILLILSLRADIKHKSYAFHNMSSLKCLRLYHA